MDDPASPRTGPLSRALALFQVRPEEVPRTLTLFAMSLCTSAVMVLVRTVRDTLFLSRYEPRDLPWMFILYGAVSVVIGLGFGRAAARFRVTRMLRLSLAVAAVTFLASYGLILADVPVIYPAFYVWADVASGLLTLLVWSLAATLHTTREAKRLFGVIGAGGVLGSILAGLFAGAVVRLWGTPSLLLVAVALLGAVAWLARQARRFRAAVHAVRHDPGHDHAQPTPSAYLAVLAAMLFCTFTAAQIADYQFKLLARSAFDEASLARYFSLFYAAVGVFSLFFHLLATPLILEKAGVLAGLLFMPLFLGVGSLAVWLLPSATTAAFMKFGDHGFQFTINGAGYQILYLPLPTRRRPSLVALLDGVAKPLGYAAGGALLLLAAPRVDLPELSLLTLPLVLVWVCLVVAARRAYVRALAASLAQRRLEPVEEMEVQPDRAALDLLRAALGDPDPARARFAAERLLAARPDELPEIASDLLNHPDPERRILALRAVTGERLTALRDRVRERLEVDPIREVRAAAAEALAAVSEDPAAALEPYLTDEHRAVRAAAIAGLLRDGTAECVLAAGAPLMWLAGSSDVKDRLVAARVIERVGNPRFHRPLQELLVDEDKYVRRAACRAAAVLHAPDSLLPLLAAARLRGSRESAATALAAYGAAAVPGIESALADPAADAEARRHLTAALRAIGDSAALEALCRALPGERDPWVRDALWKSVARAVARGLSLPPWFDLAGLLRRELAVLYRLAQAFEAAAELSSPLLEIAQGRHLPLARGRVLRALEVRYRDRSIWIARKQIDAREPTARANAYEILANVLDREDRRLVLPYFEEATARQRLAKVAEVLALTALSPAAALAELCRIGDDWLKVCALSAAGDHRLASLRGAAEALAAAGPDLVRRAAALALARMGERPFGEEESRMNALIEKVLLLKGVSLFSEVPGEALAALVHAAEEIRPPPGKPIIREGEPGDTLYVVVRGEVRVERGGRLLARLGPGEAFGELSVIDREPRSATVVPEGDAELLAISQEEFYELLADYPELAAAVMRVISRRLRAATAGREGGAGGA